MLYATENITKTRIFLRSLPKKNCSKKSHSAETTHRCDTLVRKSSVPQDQIITEEVTLKTLITIFANGKLQNPKKVCGIVLQKYLRLIAQCRKNQTGAQSSEKRFVSL